jgi:hypothetical protein
MKSKSDKKRIAALKTKTSDTLPFIGKEKPLIVEFNDSKFDDMVNHPPHYKEHPSGVECIQVTEHMNFCLGNCVKYIWRAGKKGNTIEDLKKARWYLDREIQRLEKR